MGSKDNNTAKIKTPIEEVTFNRNNLAHLITQNEESRLSNLNKVVRTLQAPNLIVQNVENGSEYKYYIKSFEKDGKQKGHLQVIKCKPDGNFYVTNYPLRNDKFSRIINNGQIIYDLSDQPDIQNIVSDNNIIINEKTTFNPTKTQTNETIRQVAPKTAKKQGLVEEKPKVKNKNSIMTYKNDLNPINENENFYMDFNYIVKKDYFELKGQGKKIKASPEFDNEINKLYKEFDENFTFNKATVTDNVTYKNATKPIAVTLEYTNNKGEQKKTFLYNGYKKTFKGYSFEVSNEVRNGKPIIKVTDNGETVGYVAPFVLDENKIKTDHIDQTDDMVKTAETNQIDDVGEFLKGNRKQDTSLSWTDLESMNDLVRAKNTTKAKIYPKPTLEELKSEGYSDFGASLIINVYNKINSKPASRYTGKENQKLYVDMVNDTMKAIKDYIRNNPEKFSNASILEYEKELKRRYQSDKSLFNAVFPDIENKNNGNIFRTYPEYNKKALIVGGNKFVNALYLNYLTLNDVEKILSKAKEEKTEKETGKTKKENWKKYFEIKEPTRWRNEYSVYNKNNDSLVATFETQEEAETAVNRFFEIQEKVKERLGNINFVREYKERREQGKNISPDELKETFGFRGVNFGNWVDQKKRQDFINYAYDSLLDLAELLNLPPKAISLNGELGLAFGAQGHGGKIAGHYLPDYKEINLTKEHGAGTLAHEWWHALDNYFGNKATSKEYSTNWGTSLTDKGELREELFETLKNLREQIKNAPFTEEDIKNIVEHLQKNTISSIERVATQIKNTFSKEKNAEEINKFIDEIVENKEKYKTYSIEDFKKLENEFFNLVQKRRDTQNNRSSFEIFSYYIRNLAKIEDIARNGSKSTEYYRNAKLLDKQQSKNTIYWSQDTELGARAFTSYLLDKMEQQNIVR